MNSTRHSALMATQGRKQPFDIGGNTSDKKFMVTKRTNNVSYTNSKKSTQDKLRELIFECRSANQDGKVSLQQLEALLRESNMRQAGFESVFRTL
jgi:hypothetical protein